MIIDFWIKNDQNKIIINFLKMNFKTYRIVHNLTRNWAIKRRRVILRHSLEKRRKDEYLPRKGFVFVNFGSCPVGPLLSARHVLVRRIRIFTNHGAFVDQSKGLLNTETENLFWIGTDRHFECAEPSSEKQSVWRGKAFISHLNQPPPFNIQLLKDGRLWFKKEGFLFVNLTTSFFGVSLFFVWFSSPDSLFLFYFLNTNRLIPLPVLNHLICLLIQQINANSLSKKELIRTRPVVVAKKLPSKSARTRRRIV